MHQVAGKPRLRFLPRDGGFIDVRSIALTAPQQTSFVHQLHLLEGAGIARVFAQRFVYFANGAGAASPENRENAELGVGGNMSHSRMLYD
jgi:hypothetical protein